MLAALLIGCGGGFDDQGAAATAAASLKTGLESQRAAVERSSQDMATAAATQLAGAPAVIPKVAGQLNLEQVRQLAQDALARALNVPASQVTIDRVEAVQWNDASLGCAQPGQMYAQVITPGFRVVATVGGQSKEVHTDMAGRAVVCERPTQ